MRLPKDPENWVGRHAEKLIALAWKRFQYYEDHVNFDAPQKVQDEFYYPYFVVREEAIKVARYTRWCVKEAEALP